MGEIFSNQIKYSYIAEDVHFATYHILNLANITTFWIDVTVLIQSLMSRSLAIECFDWLRAITLDFFP